MTTIVICDDQATVRDGLEMMLKLEPDFNIIGIAEDGAQAVEIISRQNPDLVLMDLKMPVMNGIEATRQLRKMRPDLKIIVLTTYDDDEWVFDAICAGASGYLLKDTSRNELVKAIRGTIAGKTYIDPGVAGKVLQQASDHQSQPASTLFTELSDRELEVLQSLAKGFTNKEISERLFLSEGTVRNHVSSILAKLGVSDRTQAAIIAIQHGLR